MTIKDGKRTFTVTAGGKLGGYYKSKTPEGAAKKAGSKRLKGAGDITLTLREVTRQQVTKQRDTRGTEHKYRVSKKKLAKPYQRTIRGKKVDIEYEITAKAV